MLKANKARELTEIAIKKEIETRAERAKEFCNTVIAQEIEKSANAKNSSVTIQDIERQIYAYVIGILKDNGYVVTQLNSTTLTILW